MELDVIRCMDALELLRSLPDKSVDMVLIDPPYGNENGVNDLAAARAKDKVKGGRKRGDIEPIANDGYEAWETLMNAVLPEINRVLKPDGACCCFCGGGGEKTYFARLVLWFEEYTQFNHALVWDKSARGNGLGWRYRRNYEMVLIAHKKSGSLRWNEARNATPNVLYFMPVTSDDHPTPKPYAMMEFFILNHTYEGDLVVDCFCGSGTTLLAARNLGRHYIGCDLSPVYVDRAQKRLALPFSTPMFD